MPSHAACASAQTFRHTMSEYCTLYATFPNINEAEAISTTLLQEGLIACANILPEATSLYQWEGTLQKDTETVLFAKTTIAAKEALTKRLRALHSYETPCVVFYPIIGGDTAYLTWIGDCTTSGNKST